MTCLIRSRRFILLAAASCAAVACSASEHDSRAAKPRQHPCVYVSQEGIVNARENMERYPWARKIADDITSGAREWIERDDAWIRAAVPPAGACFSYGFTGCTECTGTLGYWEKARASFADPGHVMCSNGHRLPSAQHPDPGTGYKGADGRTHFLVGSYNAWVVEMLESRGANNLAYAYSLTGDEKYADKASVILDALANSYPGCDIGSWDYPEEHNSGRFNRPLYQVARVLVRYVDEYDQIAASNCMDKPSVRAGLTRRQNIEDNLIRNGAKYCYDKSLSYPYINNGQADYIRGTLAAGVCLDIPDYVQWCVDGPKGLRVMLENNIGRDGTYYETSSGYSSHARALYWHMAEGLRQYRSDKLPQGIDLFADAKFARLMQFHNLANSAWGVLVPYGDNSPVWRFEKPAARPYDKYDHISLEYLYARAKGESWDETGSMLNWMADGDIEKARNGGIANPTWLLFNAKPETAKRERANLDKLVRRAAGSDFMGQKGLAVLRAGDGEDAQSVLIRFGPSLNHGHLDDLNINWFANGTEATYDLGYTLGSTHALNGWSKLTASHNLVLVDEKSQLEGGATGGSLHLFGDLGDVKVAEASSEASYSAVPVSQYRRTLIMAKGDGRIRTRICSTCSACAAAAGMTTCFIRRQHRRSSAALSSGRRAQVRLRAMRSPGATSC